MAISVRDLRLVEGWGIGPLEEKISLYAADTLLYLADVNSALRAALAIFDEFGHFSGVKINWSKSVLFPLDLGARASAAYTPPKLG